MEPSAELFALDAAIISGDEAPRLAPAVGRAPGRLPRPASTMVGRDDELRRLGEAVGEPGLITLVGAGGVGKTRVAVEVAQPRPRGFPTGRGSSIWRR